MRRAHTAYIRVCARRIGLVHSRRCSTLLGSSWCLIISQPLVTRMYAYHLQQATIAGSISSATSEFSVRHAAFGGRARLDDNRPAPRKCPIVSSFCIISVKSQKRAFAEKREFEASPWSVSKATKTIEARANGGVHAVFVSRPGCILTLTAVAARWAYAKKPPGRRGL